MISEKSIQDRIKIFKKICKDLSLKVTHHRLTIYNMLSSSNDHPYAEELYKRVKRRLPTISFDTVYRTLALFERYGVISRISHIDNRMRYDSNMERHDHLVCTRCKKIQDFYWPDLDYLEVPIGMSEWGVIENRYFELRGICQDCMEKEKHGERKEETDDRPQK